MPTNHVCMDYEPYEVEYTAGQPYVGAALTMFPAPGSHGGMGNFIAWDAAHGKIVWSKPEPFSVWSGALATAGDIACYGTLEGYLKAVDANDRQGAVQVQDAVRNHRQRQHLGVQGQAVHRRAVRHRRLGRHRHGGGARRKGTEGLGAVGGYKELAKYTELGGVLTVFRAAVNRFPSSNIKRLAPFRGVAFFSP